MKSSKSRDLEVDLRLDGSKAIIEGKTTVPFKTFVQLILQRKMPNIVKENTDEPIILSSKLLTDLAAAPDDNREDQAHTILITLGVGVLAGVLLFSLLMVIFQLFNISFGQKEFLIVIGVLFGLIVLASATLKIKKRKKTQKVADYMEQISSLLK
ncbi:MAG: hypothetical protein KAS32_22930 [Candidatus Peribacteraceae bacterium]|nr:hypothetical protein [Candidatus Peribacteraceae bacterium]